MKFPMLALAATIALVSCKTETAETTPNAETPTPANVEAPAAMTVSLNISGMT